MRSVHVSQVVHASPEAVYAVAADPDNLVRWAAGLASSPVRRDGDELLVDSPMGQVRVRFVPRNDLGVLDHDVVLPDRTVVTNPLRVVAHPEGAEVVFTVRQLDGDGDAFERDVAAVADDLARLARLVERAG